MISYRGPPRKDLQCELRLVHYVGQAFRPDGGIVRLESLTYGS